MSEKFDAAVAVLSTNEELRNKVMSATSAEERAWHLRDHGLDLPTHEDINRAHRDLEDVTGAGSTNTIIGVAGGGTVVGAAAAGAAA